jgi:hypothetical protein
VSRHLRTSRAIAHNRPVGSLVLRRRDSALHGSTAPRDVSERGGGTALQLAAVSAPRATAAAVSAARLRLPSRVSRSRSCCHHRLAGAFEELHGALMSLRCRPCLERPEISSLPGVGILFSGIDTIRSLLQLPDHVPSFADACHLQSFCSRSRPRQTRSRRRRGCGEIALGVAATRRAPLDHVGPARSGRIPS